MIDFKEKVRLQKEADNKLNSILSKNDAFEQLNEIDNIEDIKIARQMLKRLLCKVQENKS